MFYTVAHMLSLYITLSFSYSYNIPSSINTMITSYSSINSSSVTAHVCSTGTPYNLSVIVKKYPLYAGASFTLPISIILSISFPYTPYLPLNRYFILTDHVYKRLQGGGKRCGVVADESESVTRLSSAPIAVPAGLDIPPADWQQTPTSVQTLVEHAQTVAVPLDRSAMQSQVGAMYIRVLSGTP